MKSYRSHRRIKEGDPSFLSETHLEKMPFFEKYIPTAIPRKVRVDSDPQPPRSVDAHVQPLVDVMQALQGELFVLGESESESEELQDEAAKAAAADLAAALKARKKKNRAEKKKAQEHRDGQALVNSSRSKKKAARVVDPGSGAPLSATPVLAVGPALIPPADLAPVAPVPVQFLKDRSKKKLVAPPVRPAASAPLT